MKRTIALLMSFLTVISCLSFYSCGKFNADKETFFNTGDYYRSLINLLSGAFSYDDTFVGVFPIQENSTAKIDLDLSVSDYIYENNKNENDKFSINIQAAVDKEMALSFKNTIDAFGYAYEKSYIFDGYETYMNFGSLLEKPYYFKSNEQNMFEEIRAFSKECIKDAKFLADEEIYKFNNKSIKADVVELSLSSELLTKLSNTISEKFNSNINNLYQEIFYKLKEVDYFISGEKIHISWRRYFDDGKMCRERIKLYDNYSHYTVLDTAISGGENKHLEISIRGYNGSVEFNIFNMSIDKKIENNKFTTNTNAMIGDEIHLILQNKGNKTDKTSQGSGEVRMMSEAGEIAIPLAFSGYKKDTYNVIELNCDSYLISFNAVFKSKVYTENKLINIDTPKDFYKLNTNEDMYEYNYTVLPTIESYNENIMLCLKGEKPKDMVKPFELEIEYDNGHENDTNGEFGKKYIDILMSDSFSYIYEFPSSNEDHRMAICKQYKDGDKEVYDYKYANGDTYWTMLAKPTKYEVLHGVKKIIVFEYEEEDFEHYYPETAYFYNNGGKCIYDGRNLIYEKYFDYDSNIYTFIFDENGIPEIIIITYSYTGETLYTFVKEISEGVPENALNMPPYEFISSTDYYQ